MEGERERETHTEGERETHRETERECAKCLDYIGKSLLGKGSPVPWAGKFSVVLRAGMADKG